MSPFCLDPLLPVGFEVGLLVEVVLSPFRLSFKKPVLPVSKQNKYV